MNTESRGNAYDEVLMQISIAKRCQFGIVELGVWFGETSAKFCEANPEINVYGIDPIIPDSMCPQFIGNIEEIERNTKDYPNFVFINDYSFNVIKHFEHKPFDYLFIDANHNYADVKIDFEDWFRVLLPGGMVSLHDSAANRGGPPEWPGPSQLADELLKDPRVEYIETVCRLTIFRKL